jgi:hypothetical protein
MVGWLAMKWRISVKIAGFLAGIRKDIFQIQVYRVIFTTICSVDAV